MYLVIAANNENTFVVIMPYPNNYQQNAGTYSRLQCRRLYLQEDHNVSQRRMRRFLLALAETRKLCYAFSARKLCRALGVGKPLELMT